MSFDIARITRSIATAKLLYLTGFHCRSIVAKPIGAERGFEQLRRHLPRVAILAVQGAGMADEIRSRIDGTGWRARADA